MEAGKIDDNSSTIASKNYRTIDSVKEAVEEFGFYLLIASTELKID